MQSSYLGQKLRMVWCEGVNGRSGEIKKNRKTEMRSKGKWKEQLSKEG